MSIKNFFNLEKKVYSKFREEAAKAAKIEKNLINKIRILFIYDKNRVEIFIYSTNGNYRVDKNLQEFKFAKNVFEKADEVIKDCLEVNIIEATRDFITETSTNTAFYTDINKNKLQINFNIF